MKRNKINNEAFEKKLTIFLKTIGNNVYALRTARNENLQTVAKAVKISPSKLNKIEKGLCPHCRLLSLVQLCKYYRINLSDVVTDRKKAK